MLPFFTNPIAQDSKKNDEPDNAEKAHKSPESRKAIKKLESFAHQAPGNFQNITPSMHTINTPQLYWKDNLDGHSSNVCTDDRIFYEEILFLRRELDHKQKTINNLVKMINYMDTNSNESGENIHKNTNTQPIQINATAEEQGRNNLTVDYITYKDTPLNQAQRRTSEWRITATSGYRKQINNYDRKLAHWIS